MVNTEYIDIKRDLYHNTLQYIHKAVEGRLQE